MGKSHDEHESLNALLGIVAASLVTLIALLALQDVVALFEVAILVMDLKIWCWIPCRCSNYALVQHSQGWTAVLEASHSPCLQSVTDIIRGMSNLTP